MAEQLLPRPLYAPALTLLHAALGGQFVEKMPVVAPLVAEGEVAVFRPWLLHSQRLDDRSLAGVNAEDVEPYLADGASVDQDVLFARRPDIWDAVAALAFSGCALLWHAWHRLTRLLSS